MHKALLAVLLTVMFAGGALAQKQKAGADSQTTNETSASATQANKSVTLQSDTRLAGQLENTLDTRKARVGDSVVLKTTQAIKSDGQVVVNKGARLIGHVTSVAEKTSANGESQVGIMFDRLESGSLTMPISATISSITQARARVESNDSMVGDPGSMSQATSQGGAPASSGSRGSGGLLGGATSTVGSTVGSVANTATSTVGGVTNSAGTAVGSTVNATTSATGETTAGLNRSLTRIQISESSSTSAEGGSTLTLRGDNLRLEKGTTFNLVINQSAGTSSEKKP